MMSAAHNKLQPIAPRNPPGRAIGRAASLLLRRPATRNHAKMYGPSRAGQARGERSIHAPGRVSFVRVQANGRFGGPDLQSTGRGFTAPALFQADRDGSRRLVAITFKSLRDRVFQCFAKADPTHSSAPSLYGFDPRAEGFGRVETPFAGQRNVFGS